jgi:hypothetical protein
MAQHKVVAGLNEATGQSCCHHVVMACDCEDLCPNGKCTHQRGAFQVRNKCGLPSDVMKVQRLGKDQVGPR